MSFLANLGAASFDNKKRSSRYFIVLQFFEPLKRTLAYMLILIFCCC